VGHEQGQVSTIDPCSYRRHQGGTLAPMNQQADLGLFLEAVAGPHYSRKNQLVRQIY
jgi:hypothetical protein